MEEFRDIFRRHLTKAEREVRRRYQASDASLNILEDFSRVSDWAYNNNNNNIQMFIQGVHRAINGLTGVPVVKKS